MISHENRVGSGVAALNSALPPYPASSTLLLAPLDSDVDRSLNLALSGWDRPLERHGIVYALRDARSHLDELRCLLCNKLYDGQQNRVKAVFGNTDNGHEGMLGDFLRAEPLSSFFELAEVEWARNALTDGSLCSVFHPILEARTGREWGYESLIRARLSDGEMVGAGQLLYSCDRLNLQHELDRQARETCIREAAALGMPDATIFINFLPSAVGDPESGLESTIATAKEVGLPMSRIVFEVVETEQLPSIEQLRAVLRVLRNNGARVALDDITSGFSSLQLLADVQPDYVKIDRMLVGSIGHSSSSRHTLQAITDLARKLDVGVIAEGIETPEQLDICRGAGVDYVQGFLFALPSNPPQSTALCTRKWWPLAA